MLSFLSAPFAQWGPFVHFLCTLRYAFDTLNSPQQCTPQHTTTHRAVRCDVDVRWLDPKLLAPLRLSINIQHPTTTYRAVRGDEDVLWLDVAVHDADGVQARQANQHLLEDSLDNLRAGGGWGAGGDQ